MKPLVWSYSFLSTYDRCPKQASARYIEKTLPYEESPEAAHGNKVHKAYEDALKLKQFPMVPYEDGAQFFHDIYALPCTELKAEQQLGVTRNWKATSFFGSDVWGRGKADVTAILNPETAVLFDWKTGKVREDPLELEVQAVLLKAKYPDLKTIKGCYVWLKDGKYGEVYDLSSRLDDTMVFIEKTMKKVEQGLFYANKNALCGWCPINTCKHWKDRK